MMDNPLATYLHDHLAGADAAIDLLQNLRDQHSDEPLGQFAAELLAEAGYPDGGERRRPDRRAARRGREKSSVRIRAK